MKKCLAFVLCAGLAVSALSGCSASGIAGNTAVDAPVQETEVASEGSTVNEEKTEATEPEDIVEINVALMTGKSYDPSITEAITERLNEISESKIGVHVNVNYYDGGSYMTQVPLQLAAGDKLDLVFCTPMPATSFGTLYAQNQLMDITDYMEEYAPETLEILGDYIGGTSVAGRIYGVPCYRTYSQIGYIIMRQDILDELGLAEKAAAIDSWSDYEEILTEVAANTDIAPLGNSSKGTTLTVYPVDFGTDDFADNYWFDSLSDANSSIYSDEKTDTIDCWFYTDGYKETAKRVWEWYHKGLVYKDAAISEDAGETIMSTGTIFSYIISGGFDAEMSKEASTGYELCLVPITPYKISTKSTQFFSYAVPANSDEPEAAVSFLNLMMSDKDIANALCWGVEGRDYVVIDGEACFPEGLDASTVPYHESDMLFGNTFNALPWDGQGADLREIELEYEASASASKYLGFTFDSSTITNEFTAVNGVTLQYMGLLSSGAEDNFEATYEEFINKLHDAGMDTIIAEYQRQLDAWLAEQ